MKTEKDLVRDFVIKIDLKEMPEVMMLLSLHAPYTLTWEIYGQLLVRR